MLTGGIFRPENTGGVHEELKMSFVDGLSVIEKFGRARFRTSLTFRQRGYPAK
jgi:hypothetical protein